MPGGIIQQQVQVAIARAVEKLKEQGHLQNAQVPPIVVEFPKRAEWGDLSSPIAMALAKLERKPPHVLAALLADSLQATCPFIEQVHVAPPGFLNLVIRPDAWCAVLQDVEDQRDRYGWSNLGQGKRVLLEYVSANPTGPLHMGHGRGAALGDALARLLTATGYTVQREYYINDAGRQMKLLAASVYARYCQHFGKEMALPEDGYWGSYIEQVAVQIAQQVGRTLLDRPIAAAQEECGRLAYEHLLETIRQDLKAFRVEFDSWFRETQLIASGAVQHALDMLREKGLVFEQDGALWFRSSQFGDEKDRVVCKQNGEYTYLASDIAYHYDKLQRGVDFLINIWGADHHGYVSRMQGAVQAFGYATDCLRVVLVQMVSLLRGGKKVDMSKRAGEFVTLREVLDEVGPDATRFFFLMRRADTPLDFDLDLAKTQSAENPVYYVQYAHARLASLFRVAQQRGITVPLVRDAPVHVLVQPEELKLIKQLSVFPELVETCAQTLEPHRLTFYLQELAGLLHVFYFKHRVLPSHVNGEKGEEGVVKKKKKTLDEVQGTAEAGMVQEPVSAEKTAARLAMLRQVQTVIQNGLFLLGVTAPESM
ncbi:MAG: arginine--tRNA ligase [Nitrospirae bacterium]|nr:MAG: arginine--tRNA ligase [Nitrospirota bacterium]